MKEEYVIAVLMFVMLMAAVVKVGLVVAKLMKGGQGVDLDNE